MQTKNNEGSWALVLQSSSVKSFVKLVRGFKSYNRHSNKETEKLLFINTYVYYRIDIGLIKISEISYTSTRVCLQTHSIKIKWIDRELCFKSLGTIKK